MKSPGGHLGITGKHITLSHCSEKKMSTHWAYPRKEANSGPDISVPSTDLRIGCACREKGNGRREGPANWKSKKKTAVQVKRKEKQNQSW